MITEEQTDMLVERLIRRIEQANTYFLMKIGANVGKIRELTPTQAQQLVQILKYNGNYEEIVKELEKYTGLNINDIDKIFENYAKKDAQFAEKFYRYRDIPFVKYAENEALKRQTEALASIVKSEMYNFTRSNVLGYTIKDLEGNVQFLGLRDTYNRVLDEALLNVGQGKESFDSAMSRIMKEIGGSGLKTITYDSTYIDKNGVERYITRRLDSAVRMHLKGRLRELHNENQKLFGEEFGADGVEISVHSNPAPDHAPVQGRQFSTVKPNQVELSEWEKLQSGQDAKDYKGKTYNLDHDGKNGHRPISEMNCYHYIFSIVLGVSEPEYSDKQLKEIIDTNEEGFEFEGKHYSNYQGTQLMRNIEREIRSQKDIQILGRTSDNMELVEQAQSRITTLTKKYDELSKASGLPTKVQRLRVSGYRRMKTNG